MSPPRAFIPCIILILSSLLCPAQKKVALVIGNASYQDVPLKNPVNDATDLAATLRSLGFTVTLQTNLNKQSMELAVDLFKDKVNQGDVALFYYSGHGMQVNGSNYLIPVGERIQDETDLKYHAVDAQYIMDKLQGSGATVNIVILDACRDNPFRGARSQTRGFVAVNAPQGTVIAYSTAPNTVAIDGTGRNSPYTKNLITYIQKPNADIMEVFREVRKNVVKETANRQVPWESTSLVDPFSLTGKIAKPNTNANQPSNQTNNNHVADDTSMEPEMVFISGGTFQMGSNDGPPDAQPVHSVTVGSFYMGKYEVTMTQFSQFIRETGYKTTADWDGSSSLWTKGEIANSKSGVNWKFDDEGNIRPQEEYNYPVIYVSWYDADKYCKWLSRKTGKNFRLPSEAEWEYAAGNGSAHTKYSWGNDDPIGRNGGNVADESAKRAFNLYDIWNEYDDGYLFTSPVGSYNPNTFGLYDMAGNVWEWCSDWFDWDYYKKSPSNNPMGPSTSSDWVVSRGGSWMCGPRLIRVTWRRNDSPSSRWNDQGFRVVMTE